MQKPRIEPYHIQPGFASIRVSSISEKGNCRNRLILGSYTMPNAPIDVCFDMTSRKPPDLLGKLVPYAVRIVPLKMIIRGSNRHLSAAQVWPQQDVTHAECHLICQDGCNGLDLIAMLLCRALALLLQLMSLEVGICLNPDLLAIA